MLLRVEKLEKHFVVKKIFENISFIVRKGDKSGIIGPNGVGKTTLLNILAGEDKDYKGKFFYHDSHISVFYGRQDPEFDREKTILELVLGEDIGFETDQKAVGKAKTFLKKLGYTEQDMAKKSGALSGGMLTKVTLARAMHLEPDLLILDEPNNHLDMEQLELLESFLKTYRGTVILVTHDRKLLDNVCSQIIELGKEGCQTYKGSYSDYVRQKEVELRDHEKRYENYKREKEKLTQIIATRKEWFQSAHDAAGQNDFFRRKAKKHFRVVKSKQIALDKLEQNKVEKPKEADKINMKFLKAASEANILIRARNIDKAYASQVIFQKADFIIKNGERYALVGPNGSGKTTLLNILCDTDCGYQGEITKNPNIKIAYYRQLHENINLENTILEEIKSMGVDGNEARLLLACFLIRGEDVFKKVGELSVGERSKISLLKVLLTGADVLVLDEPTNHMDIYTKEKIEEALLEFNGAVIFVSHDRYFMEKMGTRILALENKKIAEYPGDYGYYKEKSSQKAESAKKRNGADFVGRQYDRIVLENKKSYLSGKLSDPLLKEEEKKQLEAEFFAICGELRNA